MLLRSLPTARRRALLQKSNRAGLEHLAWHLAAIGLMSAWIAFRWPFWPVAMLVQGVLLVFLFTLMHECIHRTAFASRALNDAVAAVCSVVLILPREWFRHFHLTHHRHTQDSDHDPELATPRPRSRRELLLYLSGLPLYRAAIVTVLINALGRNGDSFVPQSARRQIAAEARWMIGLYGLFVWTMLSGGHACLFSLWIGPMLLGQPFLRLYLLAEHAGCPTVPNVFFNTRTTFTTALVRRLAWNMPFHTEHHALPAVPFHRLPALHELTRQHLQMTSNGYGRFVRAYANTVAKGEESNLSR